MRHVFLALFLSVFSSCSLQSFSRDKGLPKQFLTPHEMASLERDIVASRQDSSRIIFGRLKVQYGGQTTTVRAVITPQMEEGYRVQILSLTSLSVLEEFLLSREDMSFRDGTKTRSADQITGRDMFRAIGELLSPEDTLALLLGKIPSNMWNELQSQGSFFWMDNTAVGASHRTRLKTRMAQEGKGAVLEGVEISDRFREKPVLHFRYRGVREHEAGSYPEHVLVSILRRDVEIEFHPLNIRVSQ
ncbi:MAG: hypothetical protein ACO3XO_02470 [Bdellovibrionota bacterium]|jgi:hypothetical protein